MRGAIITADIFVLWKVSVFELIKTKCSAKMAILKHNISLIINVIRQTEYGVKSL